MSFSYQYNYPQIAKEAGFKLRQYKDGPLDWRLIGSVEIERLLKEQNLDQIDAALNHLCEVPLGSILESNILDSGIAKYFTLTQFAVQYLLFCRQFMEESASDLREAHGSAQTEIAKLKNSLKEADNEIKQLRKKVNHMEAIHEVIYPCHLCSKNFISNDALNLHISRKHTKYNNHIQAKIDSNKHDRNIYAKEERENDVNLINTIKLELEIKHLKERLNKAEKEIKDKGTQNTNTCVNGPPKDPNKVECNQSINDKHDETFKGAIINTQNIGIQSNLMDEKDTDDYIKETNNQIEMQQQNEQFLMLERKLNEFNDWKEKQTYENSDFLQRIYQKLQYLIEGYERNATEMLNKATQPFTSIEHIEELLNMKFEDITKKNEIKWIEMLNKLEMNFKEKINDINETPRNMKEEQAYNEIYLVKSSKSKCKADSNSESCFQNQSDSNNRTFEIQHENNGNSKSNDTTQIPNVQLLNEKYKITCNSEIEKAQLKREHVLIKDNQIQTYQKMKANNKQESSDGTDISGNLQEDGHESDDDSGSDTSSHSDVDSVSDVDIDDEDSDESCNQEKQSTTSSKKSKEKHYQKQILKDNQKLQAKENVNKILSARLSDLGINETTKTISSTALARLSNDLQEKRYRLKKKHSKFHMTRCKIKAFVDKICLTKMPVKDELQLKEIKPKYLEQRPLTSKYNNSCEHLSPTTSTPLTNTNTVIRNDMNERLEHILASPIIKPPSTYSTNKHQIKATVHNSDNGSVKPIPMPRKRVMFHEANQAAITHQQTGDSSSAT